MERKFISTGFRVIFANCHHLVPPKEGAAPCWVCEHPTARGYCPRLNDHKTECSFQKEKHPKEELLGVLIGYLDDRLTALEHKHNQMVDNHDLIDDHEMTLTEAHERKGLFGGVL